MEAFYQTLAGFCFTLLGLWWAVVQFRHEAWMVEKRMRRMAYSVHLSFLVPGIMGMGAMAAGDIKLIWRLVFILAAAFGIAAQIFLLSGARGAGQQPRRGRLLRPARWLTIALYALIAVVAAAPALSGIFGAEMKPLQIEGLLLTLLVALGVSVAWDLLAEPAS